MSEPQAPVTPFPWVLALAATVMLGPFSVDTYLPAFPYIANDLSVSHHDVSLSISIYVFALAVSQFLGGMLSDHLGRRLILLSGLVIFSIASAYLVFVESLATLLLGRAIQAFGAGWALVSVPALVRDRVQGQQAARLFSLMGLIIIIAPGIAPTIGSTILKISHWRTIFVFLALYALLVIPFLAKTVFKDGISIRPRKTHKQPMLARYAQVLRTTEALPFIAWQSASFSSMIIFVTYASFIYQVHFAQSDDAFALLFAANIVAMMVFNLLNRSMLGRIASIRVLRFAAILQFVGICGLISAVAFQWPLFAFLPTMMLAIGSLGAISPNIQACYLEHFPHNSGTASALMGASQFGIAGLISTVSALMPETLEAIVWAMAACAFVALCFMLTSVFWHREPVTASD